MKSFCNSITVLGTFGYIYWDEDDVYSWMNFQTWYDAWKEYLKGNRGDNPPSDTPNITLDEK